MSLGQTFVNMTLLVKLFHVTHAIIYIKIVLKIKRVSISVTLKSDDSWYRPYEQLLFSFVWLCYGVNETVVVVNKWKNRHQIYSQFYATIRNNTRQKNLHLSGYYSQYRLNKKGTACFLKREKKKRETIFTTFTHQNFITHRGLSCSVQCLLTYTGNVWGTFHYCFHTRKRQRAWGFVRHDESITTGTQKIWFPPPSPRLPKSQNKQEKEYFCFLLFLWSIFRVYDFL